MKSPEEMWADYQAGTSWPVVSELIYTLYERVTWGEDGIPRQLWEVTQLGRDAGGELLPCSNTWEEFARDHLGMHKSTTSKYRRLWEVYHVKLGFEAEELASVGVYVLGKATALVDRQLRSGGEVDPQLLGRLFGASGYYTYFVGDEHSRVKIGRARFVDIRLYQLQVASADILVLLHVFDGNREDEFHKLFAPDRIRGEWFNFSYRMADFLRGAGCKAVWCNSAEDWGYANKGLGPLQLSLGF